MAQCSSTPLSTLFRTDTTTTSSLSESVYQTVEVTTASAGSFTSTATLCATEVPVGSTCETTSTTTEIVMTTGGFTWTETHTSTTTITVPSTITNLVPTSTVFTTNCNKPPDNPTTDPPPPPTSTPPPPPPPDTGNSNSSPNSNPTSNSNSNSNPGSPTGSQPSGSNSLGTTPSSTGTIGPGRLNDDGGGGGSETAAARAGKTVGIVLGSVLGAAVLGTLIFWFWRRRVSRWNDIFDDSDDEGTGGARAGRGWRAVGAAPMMLRNRRSKRKPRVDFDPVPGPYEYGLVGSAGTMSTPTAAVGLVAAAAPSGMHQRTPSNNSQPDTPSSSLGPFVRSASATGYTHARPPSSPDGSFSLPPGAAAPLVDYMSTAPGSPTQHSTRPPLTPPAPMQSRSGSPVSMDFGALGATLPRPSSTFSTSTAIPGAGGARPGSILSPMEHDYGRIGIRPMSVASVSTVQTQRAGQPSAHHERGPSFGAGALAALDELVAGQVAGQHAPSPTSPRALKSAEPSGSTSPGGTVVVHRDAGPAPAEPPAYSR